MRLSFFSRDYFNAIQEKNADDVLAPAPLRLHALGLHYIVSVGDRICRAVAADHPLAPLAHRALRVPLARRTHAHYRMALAGSAADNPDQRIAEDVNRFIDGGTDGYGIYSYSILLISEAQLARLLLDRAVGRSPAIHAFPGTELSIPGFLFWVALVYAAVGTMVTHLIGRPLSGLTSSGSAARPISASRWRACANMSSRSRCSAARRPSASSLVSAFRGDHRQLSARSSTAQEDDRLHGDLWAIVAIIPYRAHRALLFRRQDQARRDDADRRAPSARSRARSNFFVNYYTSLADFKAVLDRLASFDEAIERAPTSWTRRRRRSSAAQRPSIARP